jgi:hypothetical protein
MPVVNRDMVDRPAGSSAVTDDLWHSPDWRRLQLQPFFFTARRNGFSGMHWTTQRSKGLPAEPGD